MYVVLIKSNKTNASGLYQNFKKEKRHGLHKDVYMCESMFVYACINLFVLFF